MTRIYDEDDGRKRLYSALERLKEIQDAKETVNREQGFPNEAGSITYREIWSSLLGEGLIGSPAGGVELRDVLVEEYGVLEEVEPAERAREKARDEERIHTRYRVTDDYEEELEGIEWEEVQDALGRD